MIILPEQKVVIVTPPKCGSTSLHEMFCVQQSSGLFVVDAAHDKHTTIVPWNFCRFRLAMVVRNPFDRLRSLWLHWRRFVDARCEFETFIHSLIKGDITNWFYSWRLVDFMDSIVVGASGDSKGVDHVVRLERLQADLRDLGLEGTVRHDNAASESLSNVRCGGRSIARWVERDFERFGY